MEFTKEELKEIEKIFDIQAGLVVERFANLLEQTALARTEENEEKLEEIKDRILDEYLEAFDTYRTISATANHLQKELEK